MKYKAKLEQYPQKLEPYDYLPRPTFEQLQNHTYGRKVPHSLDEKQGEYYGQLNASGVKPEGRGLFMTNDGGRLIEGRWKTG